MRSSTVSSFLLHWHREVLVHSTPCCGHQRIPSARSHKEEGPRILAKKTWKIPHDESPSQGTYQEMEISSYRNYVWRAVFLTSFTLGIRFGNLDVVSYVFLIFGKYLIFLLTYMVIPPFMIYMNFQKELTIHEQRIVLIVVSAQLGVYSSVINQHYVITDTAAPSYFLPGLVGLTVQLVGPRFGHNRVQFLAVSVGSAFAAGLVLMAVFHDISFAALIGLIISAVCATINLQLMVYSIRQGSQNSCGIDIMGGHITAVMMAVYMHLVFSRLFGEYSEEEKSTPSVTKPLLYS
ncbi:unnamed protein product [Cylicostephanus goldi]|uniref:Uncharacterized protein n=1 Tax=Cylicostephanus goldi TaxID=71465 RepID=A0A3P6QSS7_CYLGO|nr:unnamed protein product [Cylicostephanus goldi]